MKLRRLTNEQFDRMREEEAKMLEDYLKEDKVVKFGGETHPKFGWCVIMCGGSGVGKSTAYKYLVPIDARKYDVDALKDPSMWTIESDGWDDILTFPYRPGVKYNLDAEGIPGPYTLDNKQFVSFLHKVTKDTANHLKDSILGMAKSSDPNRLPNIAFDITGDKTEKIMQIVSTVKPLGYKVAVVWVIGDVDVAIEQNNNRLRKVDDTLLLTKHRDVLNALQNIKTTPALFKQIDDIWLIMQVSYDITIHKDAEDKGKEFSRAQDERVRYVAEPNVYRIDTMSQILHLPEVAADMINSNLEKIDQKLNK